MKSLKYLALATLVAFAACSESTKDTETPPVTGTISGTVTIDGSGASGITVALSSGATTTTDGSGGYSFTSVPAGAYTITISDYPADVTFSSTSKAATISTAGATVTVGFSGTFITTSSISGSVTAGSAGVPGVAVAISGPGGDKSGVTDASGNYSFNGLRAGTYAVSISSIPPGYTFPTTSASVTVGVGEAKSAPFVGTKEAADVNATVVIESVKTNPAGAIVNPNAVVGQIDITLGIEPGTNNITQVCVQLDGADVPNGCQTLSSAAPGIDGGPQAATILEPTFSINTAAAPGSTPMWMNGAHTLSARLDLSGAKQANVTTDMTLTFVNPDVIGVTMSASGTPTAALTGVMWNSGTVTATATPIMYSGGVVSKATLQLRQIIAGVDGAAIAPGTLAVTVGAAPFTVTWPLTGGAGTTGNVGGVSGPIYAAVSGTVLQSGLAGPTNIVAPGGAVAQTATNYVALDNVIPAAPAAWAVGTVASNWWTGKPFTFAGVAPATPADFAGFDPAGVGGGIGSVACNFHVGAAGATTATLLAAAAVTDVTTTAESATNVTYDAIMNCWDGLNNGAGAAAASTRATNVNPTLANAFGVDLADPTSIAYCTGAGTPTAGCGAAAPADKAVLAGVGTYELSGLDALSGPGDTYGTLTRLNPAGTTTCVFGVGAGCAPITDGGVGFATTATQGYWMFNGSFRDLALNAVAAAGRIAIFDAVLPAVQNIVLPSLLPNGGSASFSAVITDDLDLMDFATRTIYADGGELPYTGPQAVPGAVFGAPLIQSASVAQTVNFIRSIEYTAAAAPFAPAGALSAATSQRFTVRDWALNSSTAFNNFAAGTVTAGTGAAALGIADFRFVPTPAALCVTAPCGAVPATAALKAVAGGTSGSFAAPFARVIFYKVTAAAAPYAAANPPVYVGETTARLSSDDGSGLAWAGVGTGREWTYSGVSYTATAADIGAGVLNFIAVGVDAAGDALISVAVNVPVT